VKNNTDCNGKEKLLLEQFISGSDNLIIEAIKKASLADKTAKVSKEKR
jgi:hypothetical protein